MNKGQWKRKINKACRDAGTYQKFFEMSIDTLADILEKRDKALDSFEKSGGTVLVKHTNKSGATNIEQNPTLRLINDYNRDALAYWKELGLTPAGLRRINEAALKDTKESALEKALQSIAAENG